MTKRQILHIILIICIVFGMLLGLVSCGDFKESDLTVEELLRLNADTNRDNYRQFTIQNVTLSLSGVMDLEISANTSMQTDVYDENHIKTETLTTSSMTLGTTKTTTYIIDDDVYMTTYESEDILPISIKTTKDEIDLQDVYINQLTDEAIFKNASIVYNIKTNEYEITVNMPDLLEHISLEELLGTNSKDIYSDEDTYQEMIEAFNKMKVIYKYNKSYELTSVSVENLNYSYKDPTFGTMVLKTSFDIKFIDYGKVTLDDVEVPESVLTSVELIDIVDETIDGWILAKDGTITEELLEMYNKATGDDNPYIPTKLLATQVSVGTNYLFLVEDEMGNEGLIGINKDSEGNLYLLDNSLIPSSFIK